ncbi:hypothetical protein [Niveispirillum sp. BGYR6]|uniref:hypothetical protein n=1 Tax=Niveispirillum sp. BGYR6 TaxID=2971249 RepID=UPI0022B9AC01|nr:hypothetical protein [Niveispirillum sp. BGYR6]MDG5497536.1 hypothetical protein [Niveispirillum sp. BGYR6]
MKLDLLTQGQTADDIQKSHVDHSSAPRRSTRRGNGHMGQFSMQISRLPGQFRVEITKMAFVLWQLGAAAP